MTGLEIYLSVACSFLAIGSFTITLWYRDLQRKFDDKVTLLDNAQLLINQLDEQVVIYKENYKENNLLYVS